MQLQLALSRNDLMLNEILREFLYAFHRRVVAEKSRKEKISDEIIQIERFQQSIADSFAFIHMF